MICYWYKSFHGDKAIKWGQYDKTFNWRDDHDEDDEVDDGDDNEERLTGTGGEEAEQPRGRIS